MSKQLYIVGAGLHAQDLTLRAVAALRTCESVFGLLSDPDSVAVLESQNISCTNLLPTMYRSSDASRTATYEAIIRAVIDRLSKSTRIGFVTEGCPLFVDSISMGLVQACEAQADVDVELISGVSSFDATLTALRADPLHTGWQIYECNWAYIHRITLNNQVPVMLMQLNAFGTGFINLDASRLAAHFPLLQTYLLQFYPGNHPIYFPQFEHKRSRVQTISLSELPAAPNELIRLGTAIIPAAVPPAPLDYGFYQNMLDRGAHEQAFGTRGA